MPFQSQYLCVHVFIPIFNVSFVLYLHPAPMYKKCYFIFTLFLGKTGQPEPGPGARAQEGGGLERPGSPVGLHLSHRLEIHFLEGDGDVAVGLLELLMMGLRQPQPTCGLELFKNSKDNVR